MAYASIGSAAMPHHRTALSEFIRQSRVDRGTWRRDRKRRPRSRTRVMSHKLTTYFDPSVPSSHGRSGARSVGEGTGSGPVTRELLAGVWSALSRESIDFHAPIYPWFMAVYADLFYTKSLITLELHGFGQFFSSKRPSVFERVGLLSLLAGRLRQGAGRSGDDRIDAFYYTAYL